ncbi:MAG: carbamate kinase [Deltaproteobacteria bacterium]|nr:carbamate kinase [Deltaproteobacteria bacterium]
MRVVVALGGNAIARRGESLDADAQRLRVREAAGAVADIARGNELVVTHGNGPQVGLLALQSQASPDVAPYPLDVLGAETEGMIGYLIEQELASILPSAEVATLLTQVEVDPEDPAFRAPSKPIGPIHAEAQAEALRAHFGWTLVREGDGWRRVVPSPEPRRIRELPTIRRLLEAGVLLVCAGGGGIPVVAGADAGLRGVEAVIDKDLTAALLATELGADALLLLTDVPAVYEDWPEPRQRAVGRTTPQALRALDLAPGSMGPKAEAACRFAERGGVAAIGALEEARRVLTGEAGTRVSLTHAPTT